MLGIGKFQLSLKTIMMVVLTAAAASALFAKVYQHTGILGGFWAVDAPSLFLLAILLTAFALGNWKEHNSIQIMLQMTISCLGYLVLIQISEAHFERATRYWFQLVFSLTVCVPLLARRYVKARVPRGPRRDRLKKTCEAVFFSFLNIVLLSGGALYQGAVYILVTAFLKIPPA
ncbi:MAG: hypothetical protein ACP5XB_20700 [Isosphaeraceae bacterium]